jgi:hypothetical protein
MIFFCGENSYNVILRRVYHCLKLHPDAVFLYDKEAISLSHDKEAEASVPTSGETFSTVGRTEERGGKA